MNQIIDQEKRVSAKYNEEQSPRAPQIFNLNKKKMEKIIRKYLAEGQLLDLGGYDGRMTEGFAAQSVVVDVAAEPLAVATARGRKTVLANLHELPFSDGEFAVVLLSHTLEHSPEPARALKDIYRVVAPGGYLIIVVPNAAGFSQILHLLRGEVSPAGNRPADPIDHCHHYTLANLTRLVGQSDFKLIARQGDIFSWPLLSRSAAFNRLMSFFASYFPRFADSLILICRKQI